jgi:hypothetical protein
MGLCSTRWQTSDAQDTRPPHSLQGCGRGKNHDLSKQMTSAPKSARGSVPARPTRGKNHAREARRSRARGSDRGQATGAARRIAQQATPTQGGKPRPRTTARQHNEVVQQAAHTEGRGPRRRTAAGSTTGSCSRPSKRAARHTRADEHAARTN